MTDVVHLPDTKQKPAALPVGTVFQVRGVRLIVEKAKDEGTAQGACVGCAAYDAKFGFECKQMPGCSALAYQKGEVLEHGVIFVPDLTHDPTANRVALMRLKGEA